MPEPEWVELTKTVGEINGRLIAGELENEGIRVHMEMEAAAWFYGTEDPNRLVTIFVLSEDLGRAERLVGEGAALDDAVEYEPSENDYAAEASHPDVYADRERGLRGRPLRWLLAALIGGALIFSLLQGTPFDPFN